MPPPTAPSTPTARGRYPDGRPTGVTYRQQYVRCGKPGCRRCPPQGPGHGPYWYGFYWAYRQRTKSVYVGKRLPPGAEVLASAPDSPPDPAPGPAAPEGGDAPNPHTP
jgi:hypothetical protein